MARTYAPWTRPWTTSCIIRRCGCSRKRAALGIPYAIGNTQSGFYGGINYDLEVNAFSPGRAVTTGHPATKFAYEA